ncbi:MAG: YifB family Mg chelatase-like AAA ATPase [Candidatus Moranbacteria bacterium]|nr:YifB family Mg chelatase-like AAA ATPase [Candidatus Moranbacteria bacterium]
MFCKTKSFVLAGLECCQVEIEADRSGGLHTFTIVGLPDAAVRESKERVTSALKNSGFNPPYHYGRITVSLAPSNIRKSGCGLDLAIAVSILQSTEQITVLKEKAIYIGELSLDGTLRETTGILPIVIAALQAGYKQIFVPKINFKEASLIKGIKVIPLKSLNDYVRYLKGCLKIKIPKNTNQHRPNVKYSPDLSDIKGQEKAKRALEIIASGGHNLLFSGPPGTGKTFLAKALPSILPPLSFKEKLEITKIYSIAGILPQDQPLINLRPFRSPHHSASSAALVGGGSKISPGEITLAHRGVLFLDEILEFPQKTLENLRQPLEDNKICISRASGSVEFPANFILIAAMNPCPCGYFGDFSKECTCSKPALLRYRQRMSGPIIDRIDLFLEINRIKFKKLKQVNDQKQTEIIRKKIKKTREIQNQRFKDKKIFSNSEMDIKDIEKYANLGQQSQSFIKKAVESLNLSTRSYFRVLKVARTIADLENSQNIKKDHIAEALQFRKTDWN